MVKKENTKGKIKRKLVNFIKSEEGGIKPDKVIKIGGLTLGLLGGMFGSDLFAARSHINTVDLGFPGGQLGTHTNSVTWNWNNTWGAWSWYDYNAPAP